MIEFSGMEILLATTNPGKIREIRQALGDLPVKLLNLADVPGILPVEEVGQTYEENAILKAVSYSKQTGLFALADDSGLEVDALKGMPGVFSARFGGSLFSDRGRAGKLLTELSACPDLQRTARFVCCAVLAGFSWDEADESQPHETAARVFHVSEGKCEGTIATRLSGNNGFGYDPIFIPTGYQSTFAELPTEVKNTIGHRAKALVQMREFVSRRLRLT